MRRKPWVQIVIVGIWFVIAIWLAYVSVKLYP